MKKIHLIRHAKSSWENPSLSDRDRPLNDRGHRTCAIMAAHIFTAGCSFTHTFSSPALRAVSTIACINEHLPEQRLSWHIDEDLYTFTARDLEQWVLERDESMDEIVLIGHNPACTDFCNTLTNAGLINIPTCGYAQITMPHITSWNVVCPGCAELSTFLRPKHIMKKRKKTKKI